ncbi:MAG: methyltransferase domain-containing protein, partial [Proteobacteria bacterium]
ARLREINQLCGVDAGQAILSKARLALTSAVPAANVDLICAASSQSWPDSRFDVVTMIDVLHHIPVSQQKDFVIEAAARVAPGGILIYKDMARNPLFYALANRMHDLVLAQQWIHYAPFEEVVQTLTTAGLTETRRAGTKLFWYAHEMVVMRRK